MKRLEILKLLDNGDIETEKGTIKFGMSFNDLTQILGDIKYTGDYQDNEFYKYNDYIYFDIYQLECSFNLKNDILNVIEFSLVENESDKCKSYKESSIQFLNKLTKEIGRKEKGRKYFRSLTNAYIDLNNSNSKEPFVIIRYYKNE